MRNKILTLYISTLLSELLFNVYKFVID